MTERDIEKRYSKAINNAVPDVLDSILSECTDETRKVMTMTEKNKNRKWIGRVAGLAAAFLLVAGGLIGYISHSTANSIDSIVSLDVNPSIKIEVNKKERVVDVEALNDDAKIIIGEMDLDGNKLDVAVNAIIGSMLREGYIDELANSILVSVDNNDPKKAAELQQRLTDEINSLLNALSSKGAVLSQTISHEPENEQLAKQYGISEGKAQLISQIVKADPRYTFEKLAPLSINELNLISSSGKDIEASVGAAGTASDKKYVGTEKAKEAAFNAAGVSADAITDYDCELEFDDGIFVYEIEFKANGVEHDYDINASTGAVIERDTDVDNDRYDDDSPVQGVTYIGKDRAKEIALSHAGVTAESIRDYSIEFDEDDGVHSYEIEFKSGSTEYEYDIKADDGKILKSEKDRDN